MPERADLPGPWWSLFDYLDQSEWWKPRDTLPIRVAVMAPSHQRNLLRFLRAKAHGLSAAHAANSMMLMGGAFAPRGEMAAWEFERGLDAEFEEIARDPAAWLEATPLVVRLAELVEGRAAAGDGPDWWETTCEHGVPDTDLCEPCSHQPVEEWVGHPMTICARCIQPWPCDYHRSLTTQGADA